MNINIGYETQDDFQNITQSGNYSQCKNHNISNIDSNCNSCQKDIINAIDTGFGLNNELHYFCKKPKMRLPLYKDNYFSEFVTEEEKALARRALGLYTKQDLETMSVLTAEDEKPSNWEGNFKHLKKGKELFFPYTSSKAVFDDEGQNIEQKLKLINEYIDQNKSEIDSIKKITKERDITSLGDVTQFLQGFSNGQNLYNTIDALKKDTMSFEIIGFI